MFIVFCKLWQNKKRDATLTKNVTWFSSSGVGAQGGHDEEDGELSGELQEEVRCHEAPTGTTVFRLPQGQKSKEREREILKWKHHMFKYKLIKHYLNCGSKVRCQY